MNRRESISRGLGRLAVLFFVPLSLGVGLSHDVEAARGKKADKGSRGGKGDKGSRGGKADKGSRGGKGDKGSRGGKADKGSRGGSQGSLISRDRAASIARSATGGQVLNIQLQRGKRPKYSVKILLDGKRVRKVGVDARTGALFR